MTLCAFKLQLDFGALPVSEGRLLLHPHHSFHQLLSALAGLLVPVELRLLAQRTMLVQLRKQAFAHLVPRLFRDRFDLVLERLLH